MHGLSLLSLGSLRQGQDRSRGKQFLEPGKGTFGFEGPDKGSQGGGELM